MNFLVILTGLFKRSTEHVQVLGFNRDTYHLAITFLLETLLEESLDNILQLSLNTPLQHKRGLSLLYTSIITTGITSIDTWDFLSRE